MGLNLKRIKKKKIIQLKMEKHVFKKHSTKKILGRLENIFSNLKQGKSLRTFISLNRVWEHFKNVKKLSDNIPVLIMIFSAARG